MSPQQALLPANGAPNQQDLPAVAEGLWPTDHQRIRQSLDHSASDNTQTSLPMATEKSLYGGRSLHCNQWIIAWTEVE